MVTIKKLETSKQLKRPLIIKENNVLCQHYAEARAHVFVYYSIDRPRNFVQNQLRECHQFTPKAVKS